MPIADTALRGGAVTLLLFLAVLLLRDGWRFRIGWYAGLFVLSTLGFAVAAAPGLRGGSALWLVPFQIGMFGSPALLWLVSAAIFDDEFEHSWRHVAGWLLLVVLDFACVVVRAPGTGIPSAVLGLGFLGLAIWHAISGRREDLVEGRRRFRVVFVLTVGLYSAINIVIDRVLGLDAPEMVVLARLVILCGLSFGFGMALLGVTRDGKLLSLLPAVERQPEPVPEPSVSATLPSDDQEIAILAALREEMAARRAYRDDGLTITSLAARLGIPEYRLRRLINQRLQHRNFNEFLNRYRLADVTQALSDPAQADVPILTVALDAGFGSLGPFNRAFKSHTGQTPSEFRRDRMSGNPRTLADSGITLADSETGEHPAPLSLKLS